MTVALKNNLAVRMYEKPTGGYVGTDSGYDIYWLIQTSSRAATAPLRPGQ